MGRPRFSTRHPRLEFRRLLLAWAWSWDMTSTILKHYGFSLSFMSWLIMAMAKCDEPKACGEWFWQEWSWYPMGTTAHQLIPWPTIDLNHCPSLSTIRNQHESSWSIDWINNDHQIIIISQCHWRCYCLLVITHHYQPLPTSMNHVFPDPALSTICCH